MRTKTFLFFIFTAICGFASAQITHTPDGGKVDQNADKILKATAKQFSSNTVSMTVTMVNKDAHKHETGRMKADVLYKGGKYRVSFDGNVIYCDGNSTWHWNKDVGEVTVNNISGGDDDLLNPASILANYTKNYSAKFIRKEQNGDNIIDLMPKKAKSYYKVRLTINNNTPRKMEMHNYDSSCGEYLITNFKTNVKSSDSDFSFPKNQNPNVEIIDMR